MTIPDITNAQAWELLGQDQDAVLIDVRTDGEWKTVGVVDLSSLGRESRLVPWVFLPAGTPNPDFMGEATEGLSPETTVVLLCRSGVRSQSAGSAMAEAGFIHCHNIIGGFEGSAVAKGWKDSLPWKNL